MTKGEIIHFKSKDLKINEITHSGTIIVPISNDNYYAGATLVKILIIYFVRRILKLKLLKNKKN